MSPAAAPRFTTGVSLFGYTLPLGAEIGFVCVFAVVFLGFAIAGFGRPEYSKVVRRYGDLGP